MDRQEELQSNEPAQRDKGFTLIELLIVIVILGILSTIVVLSVRGITDKGSDSACAADYKTLEVAHEAYITQITPSALTYGNTDTAEQELVSAGYLRGISSKYNIVSDSDIDPQTGSGCTFDSDETATTVAVTTVP